MAFILNNLASVCILSSKQENERLRKTVAKLNDRLIKKNRIIKSLKQKVVRQKKKIQSFKDVNSVLKKFDMISSENEQDLNKITENVPKELFMRMLKNRKGKLTRKEFPTSIKKFAISLHFISPKAYLYVREKFFKCLPSQSTITKWYSSIEGRPGYQEETLKFLAKKFENRENSMVYCSLLQDDIKVMKKVEMSGNEIFGFVNMGLFSNESSDNENEWEDEEDPDLATDALVHMLVCHEENWKLPVAYFLHGGLDAKTRANLTETSIIKAFQCNIRVITTTCDGPLPNLAMLRILGKSSSLLIYIITYLLDIETDL